MAYFLFSDILGDHKLQLGTEMVVDLHRSDYFLLYRLLPYKIDWNFLFYHLAYQYRKYSSHFPTNDITLYQNIGSSISASKPLSRFMRIDGGVDINHIIKSNLIATDDGHGGVYFEDEFDKSFTTIIPSIIFNSVNALWS